ncbi:alkaline phosphatase family protein [Clostridium sp. DL1XJH146]
MNKNIRSIILMLSLFFISIICGCSVDKTTLPELKILGDISKVESFNEIWREFEKQDIQYKEEKIEGVDISEIIETLEPVYDEYIVYLRANDGFMINFDMKGIEDTYLAYSNEDGWVYISEKHPVNSGIKNIDEIRIVSSEDIKRNDFGLNIIVGDKTYNYTIGELYEKDYSIFPYSDGVSNKDYDGEEYSVEVLEEKKVLKLEDLIEEKVDNILIMDEQGNYEFSSISNGFIELRENTVNYIIPEEHKVFTNIKGIMVNPPATSVMDTFSDSLYYLEKDTDVMVLFIDGFSYNQYEKYTKDYPDCNIAKYEKAVKANTVFKPVTNAGFAAMITGQPPVKNGVLNRDYRELKVDTIFDEVEKLGKKSALIEGDIKILNTSIEPVLNLDTNNNGYNDDEVYEKALEEIDSDFLLVHFHGLDDLGHEFGPEAEETIERFKLLDGYVGELVSRWDGKVIITADHGMHTTSDGGSHGEFRNEDMYIPYILINGEKVDKNE